MANMEVEASTALIRWSQAEHRPGNMLQQKASSIKWDEKPYLIIYQGREGRHDGASDSQTSLVNTSKSS
jgi:hypothetical protein